MEELRDAEFEKLKKQYYDENYVDLIGKAHSMAISDDLQSKFAASEMLKELRHYDTESCDKISQELHSQLKNILRKRQ